MNNLTGLFTGGELEELNNFIGITRGLSADGTEVFCFRLLYKLINDEIEISMVPREELLTFYAQMRAFRGNFSSIIPFVNNNMLDKITKKSRRIVFNELEGRKSSRNV